MKQVTLVLGVVCVAVWAYLLGTLAPATVHDPMQGYTETGCSDIIGTMNHDTGKPQLVCEVDMQTEDDNIKIFKGQGAIDG